MNPYTDLERPPLNQTALNRALARPGELWTDIRVVPETGSTNADLVAEAPEGTPEGTVLVAESQTAGRGRLGRSWVAPPRSGLAFSMLIRPAGSTASLGWLPLLTGVAVATALRRIAEVDARLKWPNDVLIGERKVAGILAERVGDAVVVGIGLNVSLREAELPVATATSLKIAEAATIDRDPILRAILREFARSYKGWDPGSLRRDYLALCATIGRDVRAEMPDGSTVEGVAVDIDESGRLVIRTAAGDRPLSSGDIVHLR